APVLPRSLYLQQLEERLGSQAVQNVATADQLQNTLREKLRARINEIVAEPKVSYGTQDGDGDLSSFDITDNGGVFSSQYESNRPLEMSPNMIDNKISTKYYQNGKKALWIQYRSAVPAIVTRYTITSGIDAEDRDPKAWFLSGSNNGTNWNVLDTRTEEDFPTRLLTRTFLVANTETYLFYRLTITENGPNNNTQMAEWELFQTKNQTLTIGEIPEKVYGDEPFEVTVSSNSGLPVSIEVLSGPATLDEEGFVTITGAGAITVRATQAGNENYFPASLEQTFVVQKADQRISFSDIADRTFGDSPFMLAASSDAGVLVSFEVISGPVNLDNATLTITGAGTAVIKANADGNENYHAASAEQSFVIHRAAQTISFGSIPPTEKTSSVLLDASASSGLPVNYQVISGNGVILGSSLSFTGEGQVIVEASQPGNDNYLPAIAVNQTVLVFGEDVKKDDIRIKVYPNPTKGQLKVKLENKKDVEYTFTIYNGEGLIVRSAVISKSHKMFEVDFDMDSAPDGFYYLHVYDGSRTIVRTIIKQ
ncbi:MAG TPA: T9SS type A sorting domain-containing protein, partial [Daejeonella sp.]|nr:T9SS type A sorting domain-containing protein [Daejeonella sp.]